MNPEAQVDRREQRPSPVVGYLRKMAGTGHSIHLGGTSPLNLVLTFVGAFAGIGTVVELSMAYHLPLSLASLGSSALLIYGIPDAPLSQPRNVIGGHVVSAVIGVVVYALFGLTWWSAALATALAAVAMIITGTAHPPGGATALTAVLSKASPDYILNPIALGATLLVGIGLVTNNLSPDRRYPRYWL